MAFELTGILIHKGKMLQVSSKFRKREFVIEKKETNQNQEFVDYVKFQLTQDRCDLIEPFEISDTWRIEKTEENGGETPPPLPLEDDLPPPPEELNDLPF
jgi:hypothetical protein